MMSMGWASGVRARDPVAMTSFILRLLDLESLAYFLLCFVYTNARHVVDFAIASSRWKLTYKPRRSFTTALSRKSSIKAFPASLHPLPSSSLHEQQWHFDNA